MKIHYSRRLVEMALCAILVAASLMSSSRAYSITYTYDKRNRLTGVTYDDGTTISYSYDATGNRVASVTGVNQALPVDGLCGAANGGNYGAPPSTGLCNAGAATMVVGSGPWSWLCQGSHGGQTAACSASFTPASSYLLTVMLTGTGTGAVSAVSPPELQLACTSTCAEPVSPGIQVTLAATESAGSSFTGWSACESADGTSCRVTMNGNRSPAVTFTLQKNLRIGTTDYGTLQSALDGVANGQTIRARGLLLPGSTASYDRSGTVATLRGGYDETFASQTGYTFFDGVLTISDGTLVVERLVIQ